MVRIHPLRLLGAAAVVAVLLFTLTLGSSKPATAAAVVDPTSCTVSGACDSLDPSTVIGANSCNATNACDNLKGTVGAGSCNGTSACKDAGSGGGYASIGAGSCTAASSCEGMGRGNGLGLTGSATVGAGSCTGGSACGSAGMYGTGTDGSVTIGKKSCNADIACGLAGAGGSSSDSSASIGNGSCNYILACFAMASIGTTASVGNNSCNSSSCSLSGGGTIGNCANNISTPPPCLPMPAVLKPAFTKLLDSETCKLELRKFLWQVRAYWRLGVITDAERDDALAAGEAVCSGISAPPSNARH